jgi:hypothetical protein
MASVLGQLGLSARSQFYGPEAGLHQHRALRDGAGLNIGGFSEAALTAVSTFLHDEPGRFVAESERSSF